MRLDWADFDEATRKKIAASNPELQALLEEWDKSQILIQPQSLEEWQEDINQIIRDLRAGKYGKTWKRP